MESPQMYDSVQTLSQLDLKKPQPSTIIGQLTLTAMANANSSNSTSSSSATNNNSIHHSDNGLVVKQQQSVHHMQQAAAANNNNNTATNNNNSILQKHMLQQYSQNDLDELTAQEITLDLQHLIDDQFRDQEALGMFTDMVASPGSLNGSLQSNTAASTAAKVLQLQQQHQHQQNLRSQQNHGYGRNALAYMPQAVHSGATYVSNNNSSDDNSSVGSDTSTIKEEPLDPQDYRRQLQDGNGNFLGANGTSTGLYPLPNSYATNSQTAHTFTNLTPAGILHHQSLPHLTGAHLASLKHHNKSLVQQRKNSNKSVDKGTEEYRRRRERNNIAVRKSREKAKVRSREVEEKVKALIKEKDVLIRRLEEMTNEIQIYKQVFMQLTNHANPEVNRICRSFLNMNEHGI